METFDIRNFTDRLTPATKGGKNRYICPVCEGNNLTIDPQNGAYQCWNGCVNKEIRDTVAPLEKAPRAFTRVAKPFTAAKPTKVAKAPRPKADRTWVYSDVNGNPTIQTRRIDDGQGRRKIWQEYWVNDAWLPGGKAPQEIKEGHKQAVTPYRYLEALESARGGAEVVFWVEGEPCADALWTLGIPAITSIGGSGSYRNYGHYKALLEGFPAPLVICPDQDATGLKYSDLVAADLGITRWCKAYPDSPVWDNPPQVGGLDVADWIESGATVDQIMAAITQAAPVAPVAGGESTKTDLLTLDQVRQQLQRLTLEGVTDTDIQIAIADLAKASGNPPHAIKAIYQAIAAEADLSAAVSVAGADLAQLQSVKGVQLPIEAGLYGDGGILANKIRQVAEAMPTAPEFLVTTLIPVLAAAMGTAQTLVIHATAGYKAVPIFRSIIVAQTGRKKTPAQMSILGAITQLEQTAAADHAYAVAEYEADYRAWLKSSKGSDDPGPEPRKPIRRRYMTQDSTLAARIQIHSDNPRGLLLYKDEASAFITERGRFSSGKGDGGEFEADLSEFNGGAIMTDRKTDGNTFLAKSAISRVGATQYSTLQRLMGNHDDDCGEFARYLFCAAEAPPSLIDLSKDVGDIGLTSDVMRAFTALSELPERAYLLSPEAKEVFQAYQHELTKRQIAEDHPSLQSAYPKFETYFGRFILWLHLVNAVLAGQSPEATVDGYTVELARQWTEYYIAQLRLVLAVNSPQQELTGDLLRVYDYLKRKGVPMDARAINHGRLFDSNPDKGKRGTAYLKELLTTLVEQRWITEDDGKYSLTNYTGQGFQPNGDSPQGAVIEEMVGNGECLVSGTHQAKQLTGQGFQPHIERFGEYGEYGGNKKLNGNGNGNGHHPLDISEEQLAQLLGGGDHHGN